MVWRGKEGSSKSSGRVPNKKRMSALGRNGNDVTLGTNMSNSNALIVTFDLLRCQGDKVDLTIETVDPIVLV